MLRDSVGALKDFNAAIKLSPKSAHMYFNRGNLFASIKEFEKAHADYTHGKCKIFIQTVPPVLHNFFAKLWSYLTNL